MVRFLIFMRASSTLRTLAVPFGYVILGKFGNNLKTFTNAQNSDMTSQKFPNLLHNKLEFQHEVNSQNLFLRMLATNPDSKEVFYS